MSAHLIAGLALLALGLVTGRWGYYALVEEPRLPSGSGLWDWNLWAICQCLPALGAGVYFLAKAA